MTAACLPQIDEARARGSTFTFRLAIVQHLERFRTEAPIGALAELDGRTSSPETTYGTVYGMDKTTVYLTPELRRALRETARQRQTSEAALIREGIAAITARGAEPRPRLPLFQSGDPTLAQRVDELLEGFGEV